MSVFFFFFFFFFFSFSLIDRSIDRSIGRVRCCRRRCAVGDPKGGGGGGGGGEMGPDHNDGNRMKLAAMRGNGC